MSANTPAGDIRLYFFGAPLVVRGETPVAVDRQKAIALLAYLLLTERPHRRDVLADLLWPDLDQARARAGLRRVLRTLRAALGSTALIADRETVGLRRHCEPWSDVLEFRRCLARVQSHAAPEHLDPADQVLLEQAVSFYGGDLLAGFCLRDAPDFENWLCLEREALRRTACSAIARLVAALRSGGYFQVALDYAHRWLALEPTEERAHQALIELYALTGDQVAARRQYALCTRVLAEEIGVPPSPETAELLEHLLQPSGALVQQNADAGNLPIGATRPATVLVTGSPPAADADLLTGGSGDPGTGQVVARLEAARAVLRRHGAYVVPSVGDRVLAVFGVPISHEDDSEHAVHAALELHESYGSWQGATGVHTGFVYLGRAPAPATAEMVVLGAATDLALRLYTQAGPGEILVSTATQRLTEGSVSYCAQTALLAHGSSPAVVYRAIRLRDQSWKQRGVPGFDAPLVGRSHPLAQLNDALCAMQATGKGRMICVTGAAGVGKSRLVAEVNARLTEAGAGSLSWFEGRCHESTSTIAYGPFCEILQAFARLDPGSNAARAGQLSARLADLWHNADLPDHQLEEVAPFLAHLLSLPLLRSAVDLSLLSAAETHFRTVEALATFVLALGRQRPAALVLEDLHWIDAHSLAVIRTLATRLHSAPVALICLMRPGSITAEALAGAVAPGPPYGLQIELADLPAQEARQLLVNLLKMAELHSDLETLVLARSEGNPFFIEEMLRSLVDNAVLVRHGDAWDVDVGRLHTLAATAPSAPVAIHSVLLSRFDGQPPVVRQALQAAAVIGREVPIRLFEQLVGVGNGSSGLLSTLEQAAYLVPDPAHRPNQVMFRHVLQQVVIYQALAEDDRRRLHGQVAHAIEACGPKQQAERVDLLAYHYARSNEPRKAVEYLTKAGDRAWQLFSNVAAEAAFEQALALLTQLPDAEARGSERAHLLASLGRAQHAAGHYPAAAGSLQQAFEQGIALGVPNDELARWAYWLSDAYYWCGDAGAVLATCTAAFERLTIAPRSREAVMLNQQMAGAYAARGEAARFVEISLQTAEYIRQLPFDEELASPYHHVIDACLARKQVDRAWEFIDALHCCAQAAGNYRASAKAAFIAQRTCSETGRHAEALARGKAALAIAQKTGDVAIIQFCLYRLMLDALVLGQVAEAEHYAELEHRYATEAGNSGIEWLMLVGLTYLGIGKAEKGCELLEQSIAMSVEVGYDLCPDATLWLGRAYTALGRDAPALKQFRAALNQSRPNQASPPMLPDLKPVFALALAALNEAIPDPDRFAVLVDPLVAGPWHGEPFFTHPYLVAANIDSAQPYKTPCASPNFGWHWLDPCGDSTLIQQGDGLIIQAANGRDLWWTNFTAPRLVRPLDGDLCLNIACVPGADRTPAIGGLLLWLDECNYLRLDRGSGGAHEVAFIGCVAGTNIVVGRGWLPSEWIALRLERQGARVMVHCSPDGRTWYSLGSVDFTAEPVLAGIFAAGLTDPAIYPGAHVYGSSLQFVPCFVA